MERLKAVEKKDREKYLSRWGNTFVAITDSDIEALKAGKVLVEDPFDEYGLAVEYVNEREMYYGLWKKAHAATSSVKCSCCEKVSESPTPYCPYCGKKMFEGEDINNG